LAQIDRSTVPLSCVASEALPAFVWSTGRQTATQEQRRAAREGLDALAELSARARSFLTLKVAGYSYDEIAEQLGTTWCTVNRQLVRARRDVRAARATSGRLD
jgi:RNA polymerase sigma factor (sigma-70 family)